MVVVTHTRVSQTRRHAKGDTVLIDEYQGFNKRLFVNRTVRKPFGVRRGGYRNRRGDPGRTSVANAVTQRNRARGRSGIIRSLRGRPKKIGPALSME